MVKIERWFTYLYFLRLRLWSCYPSQHLIYVVKRTLYVLQWDITSWELIVAIVRHDLSELTLWSIISTVLLSLFFMIPWLLPLLRWLSFCISSVCKGLISVGELVNYHILFADIVFGNFSLLLKEFVFWSICLRRGTFYLFLIDLTYVLCPLRRLWATKIYWLILLNLRLRVLTRGLALLCIFLFKHSKLCQFKLIDVHLEFSEIFLLESFEPSQSSQHSGNVNFLVKLVSRLCK